MAEITNISWCDHTFNHVVGCSKISPACDNCFAEAWAKRAGSPELWQGQRRRTTEANWRQPLKWDAAAKAAGVRRRVFCASLSDVFDNQHDPKWRADLFELIGRTPHLDWLLLTKRIGNAHRMLDDAMLSIDFIPGGKWDHRIWPNVWIGATIANQEEAERDIPKLLSIPARVRFLSCEPLLGRINIGSYLWECCGNPTESNRFDEPPNCCGCPNLRDQLHWVIAGGESGPMARPSHPDWFRSLCDQCTAAGVAFHFKQWGTWAPEYDSDGARELCAVGMNGEWFEGAHRERTDDAIMSKLSKKAAGRMLEGKLWDRFPEVRE